MTDDDYTEADGIEMLYEQIEEEVKLALEGGVHEDSIQMVLRDIANGVEIEGEDFLKGED